ncbi:hypothetical protein NMY3_01350 [Candidatus Nitrosocosmicus oleophilus]|uniref:Uncharacterized protein n=1 Tax=Candidatus Nitrosocosmicus oleophilus TaxID=1353260 RepID=A0A654LVR3_9ARCH|nr:hypothetical protein NMY3_01350 [Candidatus Nitrosocosmicus oleophilus]
MSLIFRLNVISLDNQYNDIIDIFFKMNLKNRVKYKKRFCCINTFSNPSIYELLLHNNNVLQFGLI